MANKTATLKNQAGDNIYPNIVGDNRNAAIKDSTTIKHTLTDNKISLDLDETIKEKINAAAGGKSVPPTLNLVDLNNDEVRTTITEEEYNNLKNGLYNSVNYYTEIPYETFLPSKLFSIYDDSDKSLNCVFSSIKITATSETDISSTNIIYSLITGQKDTSGNYPITIEKEVEIPFGSSSGGGGGSSSLKIVQIANFNDGDHDQQEFVMPTEDVVLFTDGGSTSFIGYKNVQNDVTSYLCFDWRGVIGSGWYKYKGFIYKITKSNVGYNIETVDLSEALHTNFEFLPNYSSSDNGKILAIDSGNPKWIASSSSSKTVSLFGRHSILVPLNSKDSDINLFWHNITSVNGKNQLLIQIYSSNNLSVKSLSDLATLIQGIYRKIIAGGIYENSPIFMIDWKGYASSVFYTVANPTTGVPLSTFTTFKDDVIPV